MQVFQSLGSLRPGGGHVVRCPPGHISGPFPLHEPFITLAQYLSVKPVVTEGIDGFHVLPDRKSRGSVPMVLSSEKARADLASSPIAVTVSVVSLPDISSAVHKTFCIFRTHIDKRIALMESIVLLVFIRLLEDGEGVKNYFSHA